ncbi:protein phosphatase 2C domain-containing protein [Streptomyces sp. NRRL F-2664]|uniref:protein phosphatase 2C domain-containing protein n=1 Tax=Streptomyces sp. NRRL F-2664 TaxID=1463842 RepID=UPI0004C5F4A0|nr:protein phosphatase 2C domain-containing protein [Streptomyces sp. NRRL F-2664]
MSQRGADDWWQKLYEDPDAGPAADPGDTLDHRFRSAAGVTADAAAAAPPPAAPQEPVREGEFGPGPGRGPLPAPRPEPDAGLSAGPPRPDAVRADPPRPPTAGPVPAPRPAPDALAAPVPPPGEPPTAPAPPAAPRAADAPPLPPPPAVAPDARPPSSPPPPPAVVPGAQSAPPPDDPSGPPVPPTVSPAAEGTRPPVSAPDDPAAQVPAPPGDRYVPPPPPSPPAVVPGAQRQSAPSGPPTDRPAADGAGYGQRPGAAAPADGPAAPVSAPPGPAAPAGAPGGQAPAPGERYGPPPPPAPPWHGAQPRDPRTGGATGYALGGVEVPPAPGGDLPARRSPAARPEEVPQPAAAPAAVRPPTGATPAPEAAAPQPRPHVRHLGDRAPTYAAEPGALPPADPAALDGLVPDTVLEGAGYDGFTLRAASVRGDSARYRGETRRDFLLTARFGSGDDALVLVALAGGDRAAPGAAEAAADLCRTVAAAVGRSQGRLADDIRAGRRDALRSGLQRLTDRAHGRLRARAAELGLAEEQYTAGLRGLLLPLDPACRTRVCFGAGAGGLFRLRSGQWQDLEQVSATPPAPTAPPAPAPAPAAGGGEAPGGPGIPFRFRASVARPGDTLLLCSGGLAEPMRDEAALQAELAARWADPEPPGLAAFLADTQLRLKGYADDRTAAAVWEA